MAKMFDSPAMRETLRRTIRAEMAYKGLEYRDLSVRLAAFGVVQAESNLRSKINNGSLGAQLFMYLLLAMGTRRLDMALVQELLADVAVNSGERVAGMPDEDVGPDQNASRTPNLI